MAARMAMMAMTTSNSINVKAFLRSMQIADAGGEKFVTELRIVSEERRQCREVLECGGKPEIGRDTPLSPALRLWEPDCALARTKAVSPHRSP